MTLIASNAGRRRIVPISPEEQPKIVISDDTQSLQ